MPQNCSIVEDLLPLYVEELLKDETKKWVDAHLEYCPHCTKLVKLSEEPIGEDSITSPVDHEKMMSKITFKLSLYQMIFVGISFFIAMKTSAPAGSFGFILTYAVLGLLTYLFYRNIKITIAISFLPIFFWLLGTIIPSWQSGAELLSINQYKYLLQIIFSSFMFASLHLLFALFGAAIGALILRMKESGESA